MATFGTVTPWDDNSEPWNVYCERMDEYFEANEITDEKRQRAILLSSVGPKTYQLIRNLLAPEKPATKPDGGQNQVVVKQQDVLSTSAMDPNRTIAEDPSMMDDDGCYQVSGRSARFI